MKLDPCEVPFRFSSPIFMAFGGIPSFHSASSRASAGAPKPLVKRHRPGFRRWQGPCWKMSWNSWRDGIPRLSAEFAWPVDVLPFFLDNYRCFIATPQKGSKQKRRTALCHYKWILHEFYCSTCILVRCYVCVSCCVFLALPYTERENHKTHRLHLHKPLLV